VVIFQEPGQDGALDAGEDGWVGEKFQLGIHNVERESLNVGIVKTVEALNCIVAGIVDGRKASMRGRSPSYGDQNYPLQHEKQHSIGQKC
jgi:hypothetical protein